jgi:hypothetical protein
MAAAAIFKVQSSGERGQLCEMQAALFRISKSFNIS